MVEAALFREDFELVGFDAWSGVLTSSGSLASIVTDDPHDGARAARFHCDGSTTWQYASAQKVLTGAYEDYKAVIIEAYVKFLDNLPSLGKQFEAPLELTHAGQGFVGACIVQNNGTPRWGLELMVGGARVDYWAETGPIVGAWHKVRLYVKVGAGTGEASLYVDDVVVASASGIDNSSVIAINQVRIGEMTASDNMVSHTIDVDGVEVWMPPTLYWKAGFETDDWSEIIAGGTGGPELKWSGTGYEVNDPSGNEAATIVTSPVFNGTRACSLNILVPTSTDEWRNAKCRVDVPMKYLAEAFYGVALWIPASFDVRGWMNIVDFQEPVSPSANRAWLAISPAPCKLRLYHGTGNYPTLLWEDISPLPRDRWFTIVFYVKTGVNGQIRLWKDNVLVADIMLDLSSASGYAGSSFDAGMYGNGTPPQYLIIDEMRVANTYELAVPQAAPTPIPPILNEGSLPSGVPFTITKL